MNTQDLESRVSKPQLSCGCGLGFEFMDDMEVHQVSLIVYIIIPFSFHYVRTLLQGHLTTKHTFSGTLVACESTPEIRIPV